MKTINTLLAAGVLAVASANSMALTATYGWEDGNTVLGGYGDSHLNYSNTNALTHSGNGALLIEDNDGADNSTTQSYVAWIQGLSTGDEITVSFWAWDNSAAGASPSVRIWGHYTDDLVDVSDYDGSASGSTAYNAGQSTWDQLSHSWIFDASSSFGGDANGLMVEVRYYDNSSAPTGFALIDDLSISVNNEAATIITPAGVSEVPVPAAAWLFGSAILGLASVGRKRRMMA